MPADIIDLTQSPAIRAPTQAKPRNDAEDTLLTRALNEVSHKLLLAAVLKLAAAQPLAAQDLEDLLFALEEDYKNYNDVSTDEETEEEEDNEDEDEDDHNSEKSDDDTNAGTDSRKHTRDIRGQQPLAKVAGLKRKRTRFAMCAQMRRGIRHHGEFLGSVRLAPG